MNATCPHCQETQRTSGSAAGLRLVPHLLYAESGWLYCSGSGLLAEQLTDSQPAAENTEVGSLTDAALIDLLAITIIERGWTVRDGDAELTPTAVATTLVQAMLQGAMTEDPER